MKNNEATSKNSKRAIFLLRNIVLVGLVMIAALFFFDENAENDRIGWVLLVLFWTLKSLYDFVEERSNGNKKSAIVNFFIVTVGFCLFVWQTISFFPL